MWNEFNNMIQCHNCGQTYVNETELTAARAELRIAKRDMSDGHAQWIMDCDIIQSLTEQRDVLRAGIGYASDQLTKVTEQRDKASETIGKMIDEIGMLQLKDKATTEQRDRLAEALRNIKNELGVPQPEYPAPIANAVEIADEALQSLNQPEPRRMGRRTINGRRSMKTYKTPRTDYNEFHLDGDGGCVGSWFARDLEEENMQMLEILKTLSQYPLARGHVDGPCIHREDMEEINELIRIVDAKTKKNYH